MSQHDQTGDIDHTDQSDATTLDENAAVQAEDADQTARRPRSRLIAPIAVITVLAMLLAGGLGYLLGNRGQDAPADNSADVGFIRDMYEHHAQAVEMSLIIRDKSNNEVLRAIAYDIITTQANQMGQMQGWMKAWDLPMARSGTPMEWMMGWGHHKGHHAEDMMQPNGLMPGMASPEDMKKLREAKGVEAEKLFLALMITHHKAGIDMAAAGADLAKNPLVADIATRMRDGQTSETALLESELKKLQ